MANMSDDRIAFTLGAMPWIIMGLCIAVTCAVLGRGGRIEKKPLFIGMGIGAVIGIIFCLCTGLNILRGAIFGVLLGETAAIYITNRAS